MSTQQARVAIVDDDASVRKALALLLNASSFAADTYGSAAEFLQSLGTGIPECLIVDLQMSEMTGLELQHHLVCGGFNIPTIVITAHNDFGAQERCQVRFIMSKYLGSSLYGAGRMLTMDDGGTSAS
jgi:FixJ family two-component response regulator